MKIKNARLILEDGTEFLGKSFGSETSVSGEVVFYTAMTGYPESLTDPSYKGQILVSTYPMIGNYGVPFDDVEDGTHKHYESNQLHIDGLIISDYSFEFSHWNAQKSLAEWLKEYKKPGLFDIDTRALTKILREKGSLLGKIEFEDQEIDFYDPNEDNLVADVSCNSVEKYGEGDLNIVLVDCGVKNNIIRCLLDRGATVTRVPWNYDFHKLEYDGLFISNGPGDPAKCQETVSYIKQALQDDNPIMGICLGNQLLARAAGAETYKLKYGHRSHNQPVILNGTERCFITSQNHGFAVDVESLPDDWEVLFTNANDGTNEGIKHRTKSIFSTQFHPEAASGPTDTEYLFDDFIEMVRDYKKNNEINPK